MSIIPKIMQTIAHVMPARDRDELMDAHRVLGKPIDRIDGRDKVTGEAPFTAEFPLEGLVHAALAYSTIPKGTIRSIDIAAAARMPGVLHVLTHENAPRMQPPPLFSPSGGTDAGASDVNVLNTDSIVYDGQPIILVIADTLERAEQAADLIDIIYDAAPAELSFDTAKSKATTPEKVMGEETEIRHGDPEAALAAAQYRVDLHYHTPRYNHNAIELHATTAAWHGEDTVTVYDASQFVRGVADTLAKIFSLKPENVRVVAPFVGGGFGGKGSLWPHVQLCVLAAQVAKRPVRLVLSREGIFRTVGGRTPSDQRVALAAAADGKLTTLIHTGVTATSFSNDFPEQFTFPARHLYEAENYLVSQQVVRLNTTANTFMRAPGESIGTFALESAMDELAYELGIDPVELRLRNEAEKDPSRGTEFSSRHLKAAYRLGAEKFGWSRRPAAVRSQHDGSGLSAKVWPLRFIRPIAFLRRHACACLQMECRHSKRGPRDGDGYCHGANAARSRAFGSAIRQSPL